MSSKPKAPLQPLKGQDIQRKSAKSSVCALALKQRRATLLPVSSSTQRNSLELNLTPATLVVGFLVWLAAGAVVAILVSPILKAPPTPWIRQHELPLSQKAEDHNSPRTATTVSFVDGSG